MAEDDQKSTGERVLERILEQEMRESFIDYSMSVNVQRALPDVRDGLKPVHRRILYAMSELGLSPGRAYKKCATVVGEVLGKYHPHGDSAVYDALVRMVQDFSLRYPLVDGQGNFGSIDGDSAAAYRYTEARLQRFSIELLADIDKETVRYDDNFDGRLKEPSVLPSKAPNLLVNGSSGIAVGMATNIPPHNLREVVGGLLALIDNPELSDDALEELVTGPDFPTGGYICGREGIRHAYRTGRGRIVIRARADIEEDDDGARRIIVTEIPFMVNKARLIEQIAALVREKKITMIRDLRDESDRDGLRVVVELKRDAVPPGRPQPALQAYPDAVHLRSDLPRARRRCAEGDAAAGDARPLHRSPAHRGGSAQRVRPQRGPGAGARAGGLEDRRRQHRRGGPDHPRLA